MSRMSNVGEAFRAFEANDGAQARTSYECGRDIALKRVRSKASLIDRRDSKVRSHERLHEKRPKLLLRVFEARNFNFLSNDIRPSGRLYRSTRGLCREPDRGRIVWCFREFGFGGGGNPDADFGLEDHETDENDADRAKPCQDQSAAYIVFVSTHVLFL
jgi:hypothetical protein